MYKLAYQTLKKNIALFGSYVVLFIVVEQFFEINIGMSSVLGAILALYTHRMILLDENYGATNLFKNQGPNGEKPPLLSFFLVSGIGFIIFMLIAGMVFYLLFYLLLGVKLDDKEQLTGAVFLSLIPAAGVYGIVLSFIGTVFPAVAIGADRSLKTAFQRGKLRFWKTFARLATGPFAFTLLGVIGLTALIGYLEGAGINVSGAAIDIPISALGYCINFGSILLAVTALSMAYLEAEETLGRGI